jgi:hypothetical protein
MKKYLLRVAIVALVIMAAHFLVIATVRSPLPAEYWIREFMIVKQYDAASMPSPKIIFSGGSCSLYGIDAAEVQKQLNMPAVNFGLHASLRLEDHLAFARAAAKPGDIIVLSLEPVYYDTYSTTWTTWNLRNALAQDLDAFNRQPFWRRMQIYAQSSDISISTDLVMSEYNKRFRPSELGHRLDALAPAPDIIATYLATRETSKEFEYQMTNLDSNGDILNAHSGGALFQGDTWPPTRPNTISPYAENLLAPFVAEMKSRNVRVFFDYTPYLIYQKQNDDWKQDEVIFRAGIHRLGSEVLEQRDAFFYPNTMFFYSNLHLNEQGRQIRTQALIEALRKKLN